MDLSCHWKIESTHISVEFFSSVKSTLVAIYMKTGSIHITDPVDNVANENLETDQVYSSLR